MQDPLIALLGVDRLVGPVGAAGGGVVDALDAVYMYANILILLR